METCDLGLQAPAPAEKTKAHAGRSQASIFPMLSLAMPVAQDAKDSRPVYRAGSLISSKGYRWFLKCLSQGLRDP